VNNEIARSRDERSGDGYRAITRSAIGHRSITHGSITSTARSLDCQILIGMIT
jgi:hypothetical protein